jgi:sporulation protein YlmC with PRC-barrel domain
LVVALSLAAANGSVAQSADCGQMHESLNAAVAQADGLGDRERQRVRTLLNEAEQAEGDRQACLDKLRQADAILEEETGRSVLASAGDTASQTRTTEAQTAGGGKVVVEQAKPQVQVDPKDPEVDVTQRAPEVTVRQPEPEITVSQPKPTVDVHQPAPEITVTQAQPEVTVRIPEPQVTIRMPEPDVNVDTQQPEVQVSQPQPKIRFVRPEPKIVFQDADAEVDVEKTQASVDVETTKDAERNVQVSRAEPNVNVQSSQSEAEVNVSRAEPKVTVEKAGEADVTVEQDQARVQVTRTTQRDAERNRQQDQARSTQQGEGQDRQQEQAAATQQESDRQQEQARASQPSDADSDVAMVREHPMYGERVSTILDTDVYGANGDQIGDVEDIAVRDDKLFAIVKFGGFLGVGEDEVAVPFDNLSYANDRIMLHNLTEEDLETMPEFDDGEYASLGREGTIADRYESR